MTTEEFVKDWNKNEDVLIDFICDFLKDTDVEFYEIDRNCSWFMQDVDIENITVTDIRLLLNRIEN